MKFIAARLEMLVSLAFLWVCAGIFWPPFSYFRQGPALRLDASDPSNTLAYAVFAAFLVVVAIVRRDDLLGGLRSAWPVLALVALAYLSAFWSDAPELVLRRATTLAVTTLFAVYLIVRFDLGRLVAILIKFNALAVVGSFLVAAVAYHLAVGGSLDYPTAWRGVYTAKNTLGGMSAFGIILAVYALRHGYGSRLIAAAVIPANLVLLYLSQSATPLMLLAAAAYVAIAASAFRQRNAAGFAIGFALVVIGLLGLGLLVLEWADLLTTLGRSATLTGRTRIWRMSLDNIAERPWLGYGFGAFWRSGEVEARTMWQMLHWIVPHAHNLWLEIGLGLGIAGMTGITLVWLAAFYRGIRVLGAPGARHAVFCLAMLIAILVENLTEYEFLKAGSLYWVLFVSAFTYLGREALAARAAARPRPARTPLGGVIAAQAVQR
jgi:exopolysaccharide production protein ExoQ